MKMRKKVGGDSGKVLVVLLLISMVAHVSDFFVELLFYIKNQKHRSTKIYIAIDLIAIESLCDDYKSIVRHPSIVMNIC